MDIPNFLKQIFARHFNMPQSRKKHIRAIPKFWKKATKTRNCRQLNIFSATVFRDSYLVADEGNFAGTDGWMDGLMMAEARSFSCSVRRETRYDTHSHTGNMRPSMWKMKQVLVAGARAGRRKSGKGHWERKRGQSYSNDTEASCH